MASYSVEQPDGSWTKASEEEAVEKMVCSTDPDERRYGRLIATGVMSKTADWVASELAKEPPGTEAALADIVTEISRCLLLMQIAGLVSFWTKVIPEAVDAKAVQWAVGFMETTLMDSMRSVRAQSENADAA